MGMFDEIMINCPRCGESNLEQSKAGDCNLNVYSLNDAPIEILESLTEEPLYCDKCGFKYEIQLAPPDRPLYVVVPFKINRYDDEA